MRGKITRLLACSAEELATYKGMDIGAEVGDTFVHPNYRHNPINGDVSASYNKPASVMHFSRESNFTEDYLLFIDADMLLARSLLQPHLPMQTLCTHLQQAPAGSRLMCMYTLA